MPTIISCNQNIGIAVIQGAYEHWFISGHQSIAVEEQQQANNEPRYVYYAVRTAPVAQLELFGDAVIDDRAEFEQLANKWIAERGSTSSITDIVLCPSYQSIIGMGTKVVPLILARLQTEGAHPDHWFWALQTLTRADPVREEDEGNFPAMAQAWLNWASKRYVW